MLISGLKGLTCLKAKLLSQTLSRRLISKKAVAYPGKKGRFFMPNMKMLMV